MKKLKDRWNRVQHDNRLHRIGRGCVALLLVCLELYMMLFYCSPYADASSKNGSGTVTYYKWTRIKTRSQLENAVPENDGKSASGGTKVAHRWIWIVNAPTNNYIEEQGTHKGEIWSIAPTSDTNSNNDPSKNYTTGRYGCIQYTDSSRKTVEAFKYLNYYSDSFYSPYCYGMPKIFRSGTVKMSTSFDVRTYNLCPNNGNYNVKDSDGKHTLNAWYFRGANAHHETECLELRRSDPDSSCDWTIIFHDDNDGSSSKYAADCKAAGSAAFVVERKGASDTQLRIGDYEGEKNSVFLHANQVSSTYDIDCFYIWVAKEEQFTAFSTDATIASGQVWTCGIDSSGKGLNIILKQGVTLTISKGAILNIEGTFLNQGKIENYGTLIIREGAAVSKFMKDNSSSSGKITCYGPNYKQLSGSSGAKDGEGQLIVMKGGRMVFLQGEGDLVMNSGEIFNLGFIGIADNLALNYGATVHNMGYMLLGYDFDMGTIKTTSISENSSTAQISMSNGMKYSNPTVSRKPISATGDTKSLFKIINNSPFKIINDGVLNIYWPSTSTGLTETELKEHITGSVTKKDSGAHIREKGDYTIEKMNDYISK